MEQESTYYHLSHNVSNLVYRFVCPAKYRRVVIAESANECIRQTCMGDRVEIRVDFDKKTCFFYINVSSYSYISVCGKQRIFGVYSSDRLNRNSEER